MKRRKRKRTRCHLRVEQLEMRRVLAATNLADIQGILFDDTNGNGVQNGGELGINGAIVELFQDNGNGVFEPGIDTQITPNQTTNAIGQYSFGNLSAGSFFVQQPAQTTASGRTLTQEVSPLITISALAAEGQVQTVIDSYDGAPQSVSDITTDGMAVSSFQAAPEAIGGERDLIVNRTSVNGEVSLNVNNPVLPNVLAFDSNSTGEGTQRVTYDGFDGSAAVNDAGLNTDLTSGGAAQGITLDIGGDLANGNAVVRLFSDDGVAGTATRFSSFTLPIPVTGGGTTVSEFIPFSSFAASGGGADFTDIGAIELDISGPTNLNGTANLVGTLGPTIFTQNFASLESADLNLNKSVSDPTPNVGEQITYTIAVTNSGPSTATGVTVTDQLPAGVSFVSSSPSQGTFNPATGIWDVGTLNPTGGAAILSLVATVDTLGTITNTAQVTTSNQMDPDSTPGNNSPTEDDQESVTIFVESIDLSLSKTVNNPSPDVGESIVFTINVTNAGPSTATGVTVQDVLPAGLTFVNSTTSNSSAFNSATGIWTLGSLGPGQSAQLNITATVVTTGSNTNVAEIISANEFDIDSTPGNNLITEDDQDSAVFASSQVDLSLTKTVDNSTPNVGENVVFTIAVANAGPDVATGVSVTDVLPAGLTFVSSDQGANFNPATGVWTIGTVAPGTVPTLNLTASVNTVVASTNTAQITSADQNDLDSTPNNNIPTEDDQASVTVTPASADLSLTKSVNNSSPNVGEQVTFTVTVANAGPSTATGVSVLDQLPAGTTFVSASSPSFNPATGIWNVGTITPGTSQSLNIVATSNTTGLVTNTAEIVASDQFDPDSTPGNSLATEDDQDSASIQSQQIDLSVTKTVNNNTPNVGDQITFVITVNNAGPSTATGVQVTEVLPAGVTLLSSAPSQGSFNTSTGVWTVGTIAPGATNTLSLVASVDSVIDTTNTAQVTAADQNDVDSTPGNNIASEDDQASVSFATPIADLSLTKTVDNSSPNVGDTVTFTVTINNSGPDNATGVIVTDVLPAGVTFVSNNLTTGSYNPNTGIWNIGSLANGATASLDILGTVVSLGETTNTAQVTAVDQADPDSTPANGIATEDDQASATLTAQQIDLSLTKTSSTLSPSIGETFTYTVSVSNAGPNTATGVQVTDQLPAGVTFVSSSPAGVFNPTTGIWTVGTIASGDIATLQINVIANTPGAILNSAQVTAADQTDVDSTPGNNVATEDDQASVSITPASADLSLTKTVDDTSPNVGQQVTFNVSVTNDGPDAANDIQVLDNLPAGLSFVSANPTVGTFNQATGLWTIPTLANGSSATLVIQANVDVVGDQTNTAEIISSSQNDPDSTPGNNDPTEDDQDSATLSPQLVDLALTKVLDNISPNVGDSIAYTLALSNSGPSTATGVQVTDLLPAGVTFVSAIPSIGSYNASSGVWTVGTVAPGSTPTLILNSTVGNTQSVTNTAEITAVDQPDSDSVPGNNVEGEDDQASVTFNTQIADLSLVKTVDNSTPGANDSINFTLTLSNDGPNTATDVVVSDLLPAGLRFVSANPSVGTYNATNGLWTVPSVPVGAAVTLQIASALTSSAQITNTAEIVSAVQFDIDSTPGNNVATEDDISSVVIDPQVVDISVAGSVNNATPLEGETIQIVFTATNVGPDAASNLELRTLLPAGLTLLSSQPLTGSYDSVTGLWDVGNLAAGGTTQLTLNAQVDSPGITNVPIEVINTDQFDVDSTPANAVETEDDQTSVLVQAPRLLQKRLFLSR